MYPLGTDHISHLEKSKNIDSKVPFWGDMLVPRRVPSYTLILEISACQQADKSSQDANDGSWSSTPGIHRTINSDCCKSLDLAAIRHSSHRKLEISQNCSGSRSVWRSEWHLLEKRSMVALQVNLEKTLEQRLTENRWIIDTVIDRYRMGGERETKSMAVLGVGHPSSVALPRQKKQKQSKPLPFYHFVDSEAKRQKQKHPQTNVWPAKMDVFPFWSFVTWISVSLPNTKATRPWRLLSLASSATMKDAKDIQCQCMSVSP